MSNHHKQSTSTNKIRKLSSALLRSQPFPLDEPATCTPYALCVEYIKQTWSDFETVISRCDRNQMILVQS